MNSRIAVIDAAARFEDATRVRIDDQIEIALPVAGFHVGQPVPLLGQRQQALGEEVKSRRPDGEFVRLGPEQTPFDANPVAEIEQLEDLEVQFRHRVLPDVNLQLRAAIGQDKEVGFAEGRGCEDPAAGRPSRDVRPRVRRATSRREGRRARDGVAAIEAVRVGLHPEASGRRDWPSAAGSVRPVMSPYAELLIANRGIANAELSSFLRMASSMPLMNFTDSSVLKVRASSSASLMTTGGGRRPRSRGQLADRAMPEDQPIDAPPSVPAATLGASRRSADRCLSRRRTVSCASSVANVRRSSGGPRHRPTAARRTCRPRSRTSVRPISH